MKTKKILFISLALVLIMSFLSASEITFSFDQGEYFFQLGEKAEIDLTIGNDYEEPIYGQMNYKSTQEIFQGNQRFSSTNSESHSLQISEGKSQKKISFDSPKQPMTITLDVSFDFTSIEKDKKEKQVSIENIKIHFTQDSKKQNKQKNQQQSSKSSQSSEKKSGESSPQNQDNKEQNSLKESLEQMQKMFKQNPQQSSSQKKLQNNQLNQNTQALKKQMQRQSSEQEKLKEQFKENLEKNPQLTKEHKKMQDLGYKLSDSELSPNSSKTGKFNLSYKNKEGDKAEIQGKMQNNSIKNLRSLTQEEKDNMIKQLKKNKNFQEFSKKLQNNNFSKNLTDFNFKKNNKTQMNISYKNSETNKTQNIIADFQNKTLENVSLEKNSIDRYNSFLILLFFIFIMFLSYFLYKKYYSQKYLISNTDLIQEQKNLFDYKKYSLDLLNQAKTLFKENQPKDAYEKAAQSLRVYLSYENNLNKEITNDQILNFLKKNTCLNSNEIKKIKQCFDLCSLVEFAKYKANKKDFDNIIKIIREIIKE